MKVTAFNLQWPLLKANLQIFHPRPQRSLTTGCEKHAWNVTYYLELCLCHPPFSDRIKGCL